jgi:hypothetical protein
VYKKVKKTKTIIYIQWQDSKIFENESYIYLEAEKKGKKPAIIYN